MIKGKGWMELVGVWISYTRRARTYTLTNVYREWDAGTWGDVIVQRSYDLPLNSIEDLIERYRDGFAPALVAIWQRSTSGKTEEYLQLHADMRPSKVGIPGIWKVWAEW